MSAIFLDNKAMQIRIKISQVFALFILIFMSEVDAGVRKPVVVRVGGYEFAPFVEKDGREGIVKDLLNKLNATQNKYKFEFVLTSANRRYRDFKVQKFDIILFEDENWSWKKSGLTYNTTPVLGHGGEVAVALNDGLRDQTFFDDLEEKKIDVVLGYHYQFNEMKSDSNSLMKKGVRQGKSAEDNLLNVIAKKVDITFVNSFMLNKYLSKHKDLKDKLLIRHKRDHHYLLRGLVHPNSPIDVGELEKLGFNKVLIADE